MPGPFLSFIDVLLRLWLASAAILAGLLVVLALSVGAIPGTHLAAIACALVASPLGALMAWRSGGDA